MKKIMVVDDNPLEICLIRHYLKILDTTFDIIEVSNGREAVNLYKANPTNFQFILMDVYLKGELDGYQTTQEIMDISPIPVIIISASYQPEHPEVGYASYLSKPYRKETFIKLIQQYTT